MLIHPFRLADRLVTNGEWLEFMADGGYRTAALWLSDGWATVNREGWQAPLYWEERDGAWLAMSLEGLQPVDRAEPVAHVSYYEADAFARWAGKRLPTEFEWEVAAQDLPVAGNTLATRAAAPAACRCAGRRHARARCSATCGNGRRAPICPTRATGRPPARSASTTASSWSASRSCAAAPAPRPQGHTRATYRNFFYPHQRWQFMGLRLATEIE